MSQAKQTGDLLSATAATTKDFAAHRDDPDAQLALITEAKAIIAPALKLVCMHIKKCVVIKFHLMAKWRDRLLRPK